MGIKADFSDHTSTITRPCTEERPVRRYTTKRTRRINRNILLWKISEKEKELAALYADEALTYDETLLDRADKLDADLKDLKDQLKTRKDI